GRVGGHLGHEADAGRTGVVLRPRPENGVAAGGVAGPDGEERRRGDLARLQAFESQPSSLSTMPSGLHARGLEQALPHEVRLPEKAMVVDAKKTNSVTNNV